MSHLNSAPTTLVVDPDPDRRARIAHVLQEGGFTPVLAHDLASALLDAVRAELHHVNGPGGPRPTLAEVERSYARLVLREMGGNKTRAAEVLGIDRKTLYRLIQAAASAVPPAAAPLNGVG